eukprot:254050_1
MSSLVLIFILFHSIFGNEQVTVTIQWDSIIAVSKTTPTFQACISPQMLTISPIHDKVYESLTNINADFIRLSFYQLYPQISVPRISPPSDKYYCQHLNGNANNNNWTLSVSCPNNYSYSIINDIQFASYGTPSGYCGNLKHGTCHNNNSLSIVKSLCLNKHSCEIPVNSETFKYDPCMNTTKSFDIQLTCNITNYQYSNWNLSTYMNQIVSGFYKALENSNKTTVFNIGAVPNYFYPNIEYGQNINDNPFDTSPKYSFPGGSLTPQIVDNIGKYFANIISYYKNGGFIDIYGNKYTSNYSLPIKLIEITNDADQYVCASVNCYTQIYDSTVMNIKNMINDPDMQFMGLSITYEPYNSTWFEYFLNKSNHMNNGKDIPIDYISFHYWNGVNNVTVNEPNGWYVFFNSTDAWIDEVKNIILPIRDRLSPNTKIDIDEVGIGGPPNYNNPNGYSSLWDTVNAAHFAYLFSKASIIGLDVIGWSTLTGYPDLTYDEFPYEPNYPNGIESFSQASAMLDYKTGEPNNKYWTIKMLVDNFKVGDKLVITNVTNNTLLHAQAFNDNKVLLINKVNRKIIVNIDSSASNLNNGLLTYVDVTTANNGGAKQVKINGNQFMLNEYAIAVLSQTH